MSIVDEIIKQQGEASTAVQALRQFFPIIEQAEKALQSQDRKDAERYRHIRNGSQWVVAATQIGFHVDGENLDELVDSEMEDAGKLAAIRGLEL